MGEVKHVSIDNSIEEVLQILDDDAGLIIDNFLRRWFRTNQK